MVLQDIKEPSDFELALHDQYYVTGLRGCGPLTEEQYARQLSYERYMEEEEREHEAQMAAGGRRLCHQCGRRAVIDTSVCTLGYPGHPGAEFSSYTKCEHCGHEELA